MWAEDLPHLGIGAFEASRCTDRVCGWGVLLKRCDEAESNDEDGHGLIGFTS